MAAVADEPVEGTPRPRYSPEQVLQQLKDISEEKRTFSSTKLLEALECQLETLKALKAASESAASDSVTVAEMDRVIMLFLKNIYNLVSGLPGALMFDALEDAMARSGVLAPFINGLTKADDTVALVLGLPTTDSLADNHQELIRVAAAAIVCFYHYTNYPGHPAHFPSDDATLLFTSLALSSCQNRARAEALASQLEGAGGVIRLGEVRWLMHYFRAQLSGLGGAVFLTLGDAQRHRDQLVAQQADFLGLLKAAPENPAGYGYYVRTCLQFQQLSAAALFAAKGITVSTQHRATFYAAFLSAQRAIALAFTGEAPAGGPAAAVGQVSAAGGPAAAVGQVSPAAAKAVAAAAAAADGDSAEGAAAAEAAAPPALVPVGQLRSLLDAARSGLAAEVAVLPEVYGELVTLDPVDSDLLASKLDPMIQGVPGEAMVLALADQLYPTRQPAALPRGAVAVGKP